MNSVNSDVKKLLLMMQRLGYSNSSSQAVSANIRVFEQPQEWQTHDWGVFGEYEYLGPGTPAAAKTKAGVMPINDLDKIAQIHDLHYTKTADWDLGKSMVRGFTDFGAGSAMINATFNPWSDLSFKDRGLGLIAGTGLIAQSVARLFPNPVTMGLAQIGDAIFY